METLNEIRIEDIMYSYNAIREAREAVLRLRVNWLSLNITVEVLAHLTQLQRILRETKEADNTLKHELVQLVEHEGVKYSHRRRLKIALENHTGGAWAEISMARGGLLLLEYTVSDTIRLLERLNTNLIHHRAPAAELRGLYRTGGLPPSVRYFTGFFKSVGLLLARAGKLLKTVFKMISSIHGILT